MKFKVNMIKLDDLVLKPSNIYSADIEGLFDFEKTNDYADVITDGQIFHNSKVNSKKLVINAFTRRINDVSSHLKLNSVLSRKSIKLQVEVDGLGRLETFVNVESKATSNELGGAISINLIAADPYLYGSDKVIKLGKKEGSGVKVPLKFPFIIGDINARQGFLLNDGTSTGYPVITITGPCDKFTLVNKSTNQTNTLELFLKVTDTLIIDCRPKSRSIKLNGVQKYIKNFDFYRCEPGSNDFEFLQFGVNTSDYLNCKIEFQERYL